MTLARGLLVILSLVYNTETKCSPTSFYKNCWIRRFPGIFIDIDESQRRGAQLLKFYQEDSALKCSRTCCITRNFSCNLAVFHYDTVQESVNCFHLRCPELDSCVLRRRNNVILYNVTKGVDPDLLVFGKYFTSSVRVWPHLSSRLNASEPLASDKRHFNRPPVAPTSTTPSHSPTSTLRVTPYSANAIPANLDGGKTYLNETKGYASRNLTAVEGAGLGEGERVGLGSETAMGEDQSPTHDLTPVWHLAANTLLIPIIACVAALLACCCTVLMAVGLRCRRKGRYRAARRNGRGSMRLIKYVIVRESP
ncbi:hypothetical protein SKAU_G00035670 [Synaphobranchus kaupii]|uniref:MANSC domain-containing protein n=1 Tax=Synaphobranchus kaupii TaxID=118154 RepID=A0A9Q1GEQ1_SYNKA|nr:hypothetical protein SKAU_G00035670 [Synaphobranchus kaupii]